MRVVKPLDRSWLEPWRAPVLTVPSLGSCPDAVGGFGVGFESYVMQFKLTGPRSQANDWPFVKHL